MGRRVKIVKREKRSVDELSLHPDNERLHDDDNIAVIRHSLETFGQWRDAVVQESTGYVLIGNGMLMAAREAGIPELTCKVIACDDETATQIRVMDNKSALHAQWDDERLLASLDSLEEDDIPNTGFTVDEYHALLDQLNTVEDDDSDHVPPPPKKPVTKPGDVIHLGDHVLVCGDALSSDIDALQGLRADLCFTDPPYNVNYGGNKSRKHKQRSIENDSMDPEEWAQFCKRVAGVLKDHVDGCVYVCHAPGPDGRRMATTLDAAVYWSATIAWVKDNFTLGRGKYQRQHEPIWFGWTTDGKRFTDDRTLSDVWEYPRPRSSEEHPTMKPVPLVAQAIKDSSRRGDTVFDPFGGSGSTLIACEETGRRCVTVEIDPAYCDVIVDRWEKHTGKTAKRPTKA